MKVEEIDLLANCKRRIGGFREASPEGTITVLHHEVFIAAPPDAVWKVLADLEAVGRYNPLVAKVRTVTEDTHGISAGRLCDFKGGGYSEERVTDWEPGRLLGIEVVRISFPMAFCRWKTRIAAEGKGARVSQDLEYKVKYGPLGSLLNALLMRRKYDAILASVFEGLKSHVESGETSRKEAVYGL